MVRFDLEYFDNVIFSRSIYSGLMAKAGKLRIRSVCFGATFLVENWMPVLNGRFFKHNRNGCRRNHVSVNGRPGVFICHAGRDIVHARALRRNLEDEGVRCWLAAESFQPVSWKTKIVRAIGDCDYFVVLVSRNAIRNVNVEREVALARKRGKIIIRINLDTARLEGDLEYDLDGLDALQLTGQDAIVDVVPEVRRLLIELSRIHSFATISHPSLELTSPRRQARAAVDDH